MLWGGRLGAERICREGGGPAGEVCGGWDPALAPRSLCLQMLLRKRSLWSGFLKQPPGQEA